MYTHKLFQNIPSETTIDTLEEVKKIIDAQKDFYKLLAEQLLKSDAENCARIFSSFYVDIAELPKPNKALDPKFFKQLAKDTVTALINEMREYERLQKSCVALKNIDHLYLHIHHVALDIKSALLGISLKGLEKHFSLYFEGTMLKKIIKQIQKDLIPNKIQDPVGREYLVLCEMQDILKPLVSPYLFRFLNDISIKYLEIYKATVYIADQTLWEEAKLISETVLKKYDDPTLNTLAQMYKELIATRDQSYWNWKQGTSDFHELYIHLFEKFIPLYKKEEEIRSRIQFLESRLLLTKPHLVACSIASITTIREEAPLIKLYLEEELKETFSYEEFPLPDTSLNKDPVLDTVFQDLKQDEVIPESKKSEEYSFAFYKKPDTVPKTVKLPKVSKSITSIQLNSDQLQTFKEVFGLEAYTTIGLRALVNLAQALGGVLKKTGANRCRIELKNIYAHILLPTKDLEACMQPHICTTATVVMHGGGHRSKRSQNSDQGEAQPYLVAQFQAAFIRAGFTPENLDLTANVFSFYS